MTPSQELMAEKIRKAKPPFTPEQRELARQHELAFIEKYGQLIQCPQKDWEEAMSQLNATKESSNTPSVD